MNFTEDETYEDGKYKSRSLLRFIYRCFDRWRHRERDIETELAIIRKKREERKKGD